METAKMSISTDALAADGNFDPRYTCDIDNSSPELRWESPPEGTSTFVLIAEDVDAPAGVFTHWLVYNIPSDVHHLPAGIPPQESLPNGIKQGINSFGKLGYAGPCPPLQDRPHRYYFRLLALSQTPSIPQRVKRDELLATIEPFVISTAHIMGRYQRVAQKAG
jgi:Raf kinase inhibitor-like YbhB/YbcL family protein